MADQFDLFVRSQMQDRRRGTFDNLGELFAPGGTIRDLIVRLAAITGWPEKRIEALRAGAEHVARGDAKDGTAMGRLTGAIAVERGNFPVGDPVMDPIFTGIIVESLYGPAADDLALWREVVEGPKAEDTPPRPRAARKPTAVDLPHLVVVTDSGFALQPCVPGTTGELVLNGGHSSGECTWQPGN